MARPEFVPLCVPKLIALSLAGETSGFLAAGRFAGGAGGVGFARLPPGGGACPPLTSTDGVGMARGGAAGGGGGGGGAARVASISST